MPINSAILRHFPEYRFGYWLLRAEFVVSAYSFTRDLDIAKLRNAGTDLKQVTNTHTAPQPLRREKVNRAAP